MDKRVRDKFENYPERIQAKLHKVRSLIFEVARLNSLDVEETLKWSEPSYLVKGGSTVRYDWKPESPDQYALYFNCNTKLVDTFKELYSDIFTFEGNRAILFEVDGIVYEEQLRQCIELAFKYHQVKHLPLLGAIRIESS